MTPTNLPRIRRLLRLLDFRVPGILLFLLVFLGKLSLVIIVFGIAAAVTSPWILWQLVRIGKRSWAVAFVFLVAWPVVGAQFLTNPRIAFLLGGSGFLIMAYGYLWVLKLAAKEWEREESWRLRFEAEDRAAQAQAQAQAQAGAGAGAGTGAGTQDRAAQAKAGSREEEAETGYDPTDSDR